MFFAIAKSGNGELRTSHDKLRYDAYVFTPARDSRINCHNATTFSGVLLIKSTRYPDKDSKIFDIDYSFPCKGEILLPVNIKTAQSL